MLMAIMPNIEHLSLRILWVLHELLPLTGATYTGSSYVDFRDINFDNGSGM